MAQVTYLEYSGRDYQYAADILKMGHYNPCGRFCQQSVEKRYKAYIEVAGSIEDMRVMTSHNLTLLYRRICQLLNIPIDLETMGELALLSSYYFDTNYPKEENIELTKDEAEQALEIAEKLNNWTDTLLSSV
ncbi:hypothetical protein FACS1894219_11110 [Clostridia bacterium]|nr:hypothetical protein FACS1894219_11110 [Clostridia bacterium]